MKHKRILDRKLVAACDLSVIDKALEIAEYSTNPYVCWCLAWGRETKFLMDSTPEKTAFMTLFDDGTVSEVEQKHDGLFGPIDDDDTRQARLTALALFYTIIKEEKSL